MSPLTRETSEVRVAVAEDILGEFEFIAGDLHGNTNPEHGIYFDVTCRRAGKYQGNLTFWLTPDAFAHVVRALGVRS